jgi:putative membrane protein
LDITHPWFPYCGAAPAPAEIWQRWNMDPLVLVSLLLVVGIVWRRTDEAARLNLLGATALAAVLFVSPLCALTSALFSARAVHHVLLTAVLAPLLAVAWPGAKRPAAGIWTAAHVAIFWFWHAPAAYSWALSHDAAYWVMQFTLLGSAAGFWAAVQRAPALHAVAALLMAMVQMGLLGALLTFSSYPFYAPHLLGPQVWGLSPLEDQQLAGLIMWVPAAGLYLAAALYVFMRWVASEQVLGRS